MQLEIKEMKNYLNEVQNIFQINDFLKKISQEFFFQYGDNL